MANEDGQEDGHMTIFLRPLSTMVCGKAPKMANFLSARVKTYKMCSIIFGLYIMFIL